MSNAPEDLAEAHLYAHLEMDRWSTGELTCEGLMPIGPDAMTPGGIRAALIALLLEGIFGDNLLARGFPVLSNMTFQVRDTCHGVTRARAVGELARFGSRSAIGRGHVEDADEPSRVLGYGTIGFRMIQPRTDYTPAAMAKSLANAAVRESDRPRRSILDAMGLRVDVDEGTCRVDDVHGAVMGPEGRLHGGAHQLMHEAAAIAAATREADTNRVVTGDFNIHFVAPAVGGPFVARSRLLSKDARDALFSVELRDAAGDDAPRSLSMFRMRWE